MLNSLGASSMFSLARVTLRRMQSSEQVAHLQPFGRGLAAAQQRAHAGQQFDEGEGLDQIIVGAQFQALDAIVHGVARAQDQHRRADFAIADLLQHAEAVHVGQHQVQNDQVVLGGMDQVDGGGAVAGDVDRVAGAFQTPGQEVLDALFVLDDEYSHWLGGAYLQLNHLVVHVTPASGITLRREVFAGKAS